MTRFQGSHSKVVFWKCHVQVPVTHPSMLHIGSQMSESLELRQWSGLKIKFVNLEYKAGWNHVRSG